MRRVLQRDHDRICESTLWFSGIVSFVIQNLRSTAKLRILCEKHILSNEVVFICQRDVVWLAVAMSFQKRSAEG